MPTPMFVYLFICFGKRKKETDRGSTNGIVHSGQGWNRRAPEKLRGSGITRNYEKGFVSSGNKIK